MCEVVSGMFSLGGGMDWREKVTAQSCGRALQSASSKFRLETNSTVVWLYAGGVSLILPDVQFGTRLGHIHDH